MSALNYYPIYSGGMNMDVGTSGWTTTSSISFTDQNTGDPMPSGTEFRYQCVTVANIGSVGVVFTFGNSSTVVSAASADSGYRVAPGETKRIETFSLGGSTGVKSVGIRVDPTLTTANLGNVLTGSVFLYAEFGSQ